MAQVVCQVLVQSDRFVFIWSEGGAFFEPYSIAGQSLTRLQELMRQAKDRLGQQARTAGDDANAMQRAAYELARAGHALYEQVLAGDVDQGIRAWLVARRSDIDTLEIVSDAADVFPWQVVYDEAPDERAFAAEGAGWHAFWGCRYALSTGRRVNPLRQESLLEQPRVLLAIDPQARASLAEEERQFLTNFTQSHALALVESVGRLRAELEGETPDVLYVLCRASGDTLWMGPEPLTLEALRELLGGAAAGRYSRTLLFLNVCADEGPADSDRWIERLQALGFTTFLATREPIPAAGASRFGVKVLGDFLYSGKSLDAVARKQRSDEPSLGLLYTSSCPPHVRVRWETDGGEDGIRADTSAPLENGAKDTREPEPLPDKPYRPLAPYDREERGLFIGREEETASLAQLLDEPGTRLVLLHGPTGVGKSSLLRAGVVPFLEERCAGYRVLRDRSDTDDGDFAEDDFPVVTIPATCDLCGQLALALVRFCARPYRYRTPTGRLVSLDLPALLRATVGGLSAAVTDTGITAQAPLASGSPPALPPTETLGSEDLWRALRDDASMLGRLLAVLSDRLPHELIVIIEQGEELFSLAQRLPDRSFRRKAIETLRGLAERAGRAMVVLELRTEYYGRFLHALDQTSADAGWLRSYFLGQLGEEQMVEALSLPTALEPIPGYAEAPYQKYRFLYEEGLMRDLVRDARNPSSGRPQSVLASLQATCARLVESIASRLDRVLRLADLKHIGGVEAGLARYVQERIKLVAPKSGDRKALAQLIESLHVQHADGTVTRDLVAVDEAAKTWRGATPLATALEAAAGDNARLLEVSWLNLAGKEGAYVSLGSDALAATSAQLAEDARKFKHSRTRIFDTLWITVPLLILAGAGLFFLWRGNVTMQRDLKTLNETAKELALQNKGLEKEAANARFSAYIGHLHLAQQALRAGDSVRYRQFLQMHLPAPPRRDPETDEVTQEVDLRGFEWFYLWRLGNGERRNLVGHLGPVTAVVLSSDNKTLASASMDGTVKVWDADKGFERARLIGHQGPVNGVALTKDGKLLASAGQDKTIRLWSVAPVKDEPLIRTTPLASLTGHDGPIRAVTFADDGKTLASASEDKTVKLWDVAANGTATVRETFTEHTAAVHALAFSPDGKILASAGADESVRLWDVDAPGKKSARHVLKGQGGPIHALAFASDGKTLASGGEKLFDGRNVGSVMLWDPSSGKDISKPARAPLAPVFSLAFTKDNEALVIGSKDNAAQWWDVASGAVRAGIRGHLGWVRALAVSTDGKLATGSYDTTVKLWDVARGPEPDVLHGHTGSVHAVAFSADDKQLVTGGADGTVRLWDVATGEARHSSKKGTGHTGAVLAVVLASDGKLVASAGADQSIVLWKLGDGAKGLAEPAMMLKGHKKEVTSLVFTPDGKTLISGSADNSVILWNVEDGAKDFGKERRTLTGHTDRVRCLALQGRKEQIILATGSDDHTIILWDADTGKRAVTLRGHTGPVTSMGFWKAYLVSGSMDRTLQTWNIDEVKAERTIRGHGGAVLGVAFSPSDRTTYVSAGADHTLKLWDLHRDAERFSLQGHTGPVLAVAYATNGKTIASASQDGTVRLWRAAADRFPQFKHP
jgi:WD40 repeat protein